MGFCLYNNVAVGRGARAGARPEPRRHRRHRRASWQRHAVDLLRRSARLLCVHPPVSVLSRHGRGRRGRHRAGAGFTVNIPLEAGATDADYALVHRRDRAVRCSSSSGRSCCSSPPASTRTSDDPLASMRVTTSGYAAIVRRAAGVERALIALVTEGGYDLAALARASRRRFSRCRRRRPNLTASR